MKTILHKAWAGSLNAPYWSVAVFVLYVLTTMFLLMAAAARTEAMNWIAGVSSALSLSCLVWGYKTYTPDD